MKKNEDEKSSSFFQKSVKVPCFLFFWQKFFEYLTCWNIHFLKFKIILHHISLYPNTPSSFIALLHSSFLNFGVSWRSAWEHICYPGKLKKQILGCPHYWLFWCIKKGSHLFSRKVVPFKVAWKSNLLSSFQIHLHLSV